MHAEARAASPSAGFDCATCGAQLDLLHLDVAPDRARCSFCGTPQDVQLADPAPSAPSVDVGETLRHGREVRGETLEQAARFTRIRPSYLRELERGDARAFDPYPGRVYARFFLREYAVHLGLEPGPLVRRFDASPDPMVVPVPPRPKQVRQPHHRRWAIGAALVLAIALVVGALATRDSGPALPSAAAPAPREVAPDASLPGGPGDRRDAPPPISELAASVEATRDCWILAMADGEVVLQETVPAGETVELEARRTLDLRLGDAGAVRLVVDGRRVPTGPSGAVADLSFAIRDGELVRT
jgi:cytoskeleton protein RodZ